MKSRNGAQPVSCGCATVDLSEVFFEPVFEPVDVIVTGLHGLFGQKRVEQGDCGVDAVNDQFAQGTCEPRQCLWSVTPVHDELAD